MPKATDSREHHGEAEAVGSQVVMLIPLLREKHLSGEILRSAQNDKQCDAQTRIPMNVNAGSGGCP